MSERIQLFEDQRVRTAWDEEKQEWYFSVVDVCAVLSGASNPRRYWSDLKRKLKAEGADQLYEKIVQLKMTPEFSRPQRRQTLATLHSSQICHVKFVRRIFSGCA